MTNKEWLDYLAQNAPDELAAWFDAEHVEHQERALDGDTDTQDGDSRELILTDLEKKTREWHDYDGNFMRIYSDVAYAQMKELLDRQAAITERETTKRHELFCETCEAESDKQIAELTAERDKLEADVRKIAEAYNMDTQRHGTERFAHELYYSIIHLLDRQAAITERKLDAEFEAACNSCATKIDLREEVDKLTAERDKLQEQLRIGWECECRLQAERERYRSKFGKCIDYADAIHALMDDEGMA